MKVKNLIGNKYGSLEVVAHAGANHRRQSLWKVRCVCGQEKVVVGAKLTQGLLKSCGCLARNTPLDLVGQRFGKLVVQDRSTAPASCGQRHLLWDCLCACGETVAVPGSKLKNGHVKSCGCLSAEVAGNINRSHGMSNTRTYRIWSRMKQRCTNPKSDDYYLYGGRGIKVCPRWMNSFDNFLADMGVCPMGLTIERINNEGDYEPSNCKWADLFEQAKNKRPRSDVWNPRSSKE